VYQLELVRQEWRGLMAGATTLASGLSAALVALLGGRLIASTGYSALFLAAGLASLAGVAWFWACFRTPRGEYAVGREIARPDPS
jgi:predicted MFS family arabinose efflux permease